MVAAVRQTGAPVWYLLGKNEGHGFSDPKNYFYALYATTLFMEEFLLK
jgi:dipeptidyl aminopeptidase/acylaminoacyl peptidase